MKKIVPILLLLVVFTLSSFRHQKKPIGKKIYDTRCARCHGAEGTRHFLGAKDLQKSSLSDSAVVKIIFNGKKIMPSFKTTLSKEEIYAVTGYVKTLRR